LAGGRQNENRLSADAIRKATDAKDKDGLADEERRLDQAGVPPDLDFVFDDAVFEQGRLYPGETSGGSHELAYLSQEKAGQYGFGKRGGGSLRHLVDVRMGSTRSELGCRAQRGRFIDTAERAL
jgi:hypothetical protein